MIPDDLSDPINRRILAVAEDQLKGFYPRPFDAIALRCGLSVEAVLERMRAMLAAGTIRRLRQTLLSTSLADGALVAWALPDDCLERAWEWLKENDPFTGHIVLRRADDPSSPGAGYRLWTTLKVPVGCGSAEAHCRILASWIHARDFVLLPVEGVFALGVGHVRRAHLKPGERLSQPAVMQKPARPQLSEVEWKVLLSLKESLSPGEVVRDPWEKRAHALGLSSAGFNEIASQLDAKQVIGRFAAFLHYQGKKDVLSGTGASGLFHWTVPAGWEERAGSECGRHICMTHCYWRRGGKIFGGAQIMGVVHAPDREGVRAHKEAIDAHLQACGIPVLHTAVFWSERAEIRPSEISPLRYRQWLEERGNRQMP